MSFILGVLLGLSIDQTRMVEVRPNYCVNPAHVVSVQKGPKHLKLETVNSDIPIIFRFSTEGETNTKYQQLRNK